MTMLLTEPAYKYDDLKTISVPVLVLAGESDIIKEAHTKKIAEYIRKGKLLIASKETHDFPLENPGRFNSIVIDFLMD